MKLKKLLSVFLTTAMLIAFTVPFSTVSAAIPDITVKVSATPYTVTSSASVNIPLSIEVKVNTGSETVTKIAVSGNFVGSADFNTAIAAGASTIFTVPTTFSGRSTSANITVTTTGKDPYNVPTTVSEITPYSSVSPGGGGDSGDTTTDVDPKPYIFSMDTTVFKAGDIIPVAMKISTMDGYADDVRMKLAGPEGFEEMFSFHTTTGWLTVGNLTDTLDTKPFVKINPSVPDGTYKVKVKFDYLRSGKTKTSESELNFIVKGKSNTVPYIKSANFAVAEIGKENKSSVIVNVANASSGEFNDVNISFNAAGSKGFSLYDSTRNIALNTIAPHSTKNATFPIYIDSAVTTGNYPIAFDVSYKDGSDAIITSVEQIYIQVTRSTAADEKDSTPRIIVSSYKTDTEVIKAGQSFTLDFSLKNTSSLTDVNNVKVVLGSAVTSGTGQNSAGGAVFFPAQGSNSFFIASIGKGAESTNTIKLMARQDVEPGVYPVLLKLDFESTAGKPFSSEEQISFSVTQEQRLDIQAVTIPTDAMMGGAIPVNFQYINKGKSTIFNLSVTADGDFSLEGGSQYIGNLTAGFNDYFDNILMPAKEGSLKGDIILKFEDSNGDEQEHRIPVTCNVSAAMDIGGFDKPGMGGVEPVPVQQGGGLISKILWVGIPVLVVVIAILAFVIIMKKRKSKKDLVADEED